MRFDNHALILAVVEGLRQQGNWTGETHVQDTLFLLEASGLVKTQFKFVRYPSGPYPLDFIAEFEEMKSHRAAHTRRYGWPVWRQVGPGREGCGGQTTVSLVA